MRARPPRHHINGRVGISAPRRRRISPAPPKGENCDVRETRLYAEEAAQRNGSVRHVRPQQWGAMCAFAEHDLHAARFSTAMPLVLAGEVRQSRDKGRAQSTGKISSRSAM